MKILGTMLLMLNLGGAAGAFELQSLKAADLAGLPAADQPAKAAPAQTTQEEIAAAYATLKDYFAGGYAPVESDLLGDWEGRAMLKEEDGTWQVWSPSVSFIRKTYPSALGPLFQEDSHELYARMPYLADTLERRVSLDARDASFQFQHNGARTVTFRRFDRWNEVMLVMRTDCYGGTTYAYFFKKKAGARQGYSGPLPTGDLFGPLPPYFHGQIGPMIRDGHEVQGVLEYHSGIIFYADKAAAQAAAGAAAAKISAAGRTVVSATAERSGEAWTASVGFTGKTGVLFRWDDELPTREEAAEVMARKIARYEREGYAIMETSLSKLGQKYAFFIVCAKFL